MLDRFKRLLAEIEQNYRSFVWFVAKLIFWVLILVWITPILASAFINIFKPNNVTINDFILFVTAAFIIAYTYETQKMRAEMVKQTELGTMPIMCLYIRYISGIKDEEKREKLKSYAITNELDGGIRPSNYYLALRNMGKGPAFNVDVESKNFKVEKYQTKFFAPEPKGDEHAIKVIKKPSNKIRSLEELKNEVLIIKCKSVFGKVYEYKYKINDVTERSVEFIK